MVDVREGTCNSLFWESGSSGRASICGIEGNLRRKAVVVCDCKFVERSGKAKE